jgi:hypothetical protein
LKFLVSWCWYGKDANEVTERFKKWKPTGDYKFLYPVSTIAGANKAFAVVEMEKIEEWYKDARKFSDICTFTVEPIIDSREAVKLA